MTDDPKDDNVVKLDPGKRVPWLKRKEQRPRCRHMPVTVCDTTRVVECDLCGAILDPVQVLLDIAYMERLLYHSEKALAAANKRTVELRKEEKRIKARLKTARARLKETEGGN